MISFVINAGKEKYDCREKLSGDFTECGVLKWIYSWMSSQGKPKATEVSLQTEHFQTFWPAKGSQRRTLGGAERAKWGPGWADALVSPPTGRRGWYLPLACWPILLSTLTIPGLLGLEKRVQGGHMEVFTLESRNGQNKIIYRISASDYEIHSESHKIICKRLPSWTQTVTG